MYDVNGKRMENIGVVLNPWRVLIYKKNCVLEEEAVDDARLIGTTSVQFVPVLGTATFDNLRVTGDVKSCQFGFDIISPSDNKVSTVTSKDFVFVEEGEPTPSTTVKMTSTTTAPTTTTTTTTSTTTTTTSTTTTSTTSTATSTTTAPKKNLSTTTITSSTTTTTSSTTSTTTTATKVTTTAPKNTMTTKSAEGGSECENVEGDPFDKRQKWNSDCSNVCLADCNGENEVCKDISRCEGTESDPTYAICDDGCTCDIKNMPKTWDINPENFVSSECDATGMQIRMNKCVINRFGFKLKDLFLNGPITSSNFENLDSSDKNSCRGRIAYENGPEYIFRIDRQFSDCNTMVKNDGTHVTYENALQSKSSEAASNVK